MDLRRRWLRRLVVLIVLLAAAALGLRWALQPERLGALLLAQVAEASGLHIRVATPARLGFWPGLHLQLDGLEAGVAGDTPLLRALRVELFLPLSALWQPLRLQHIALEAPQIDLEALARWQEASRDAGPPAPLVIPAITRLSLADGSLRWGSHHIDALQLQLDRLLPGETVSLQVEAMLRPGDPEHSVPLTLQVEGVWQQGVEGLRLDPIRLQAGGTAQPAALDLRGALWWSPPQRLDLDLNGALAALPADWPFADTLAPLQGAQLRLAHAGPANLGGPMTLAIDGTDYRGSAGLQLPALLDWLAAGDWTAAPPLQLQVEAERIEHDGIVIEGLRIEHGSGDGDDAD
jgi:hypothetical protein